MASSVNIGATYGVGIYGTDSYGEYGVVITVDGVEGTGAITTADVVGDANLSLPSVSAVVTTDDPVVIGDEVVVDAEAVVDAAAVEGTGVVNDPTVSLPTTISVTGVSATGTADPLGPIGVEAVGEIGDELLVTTANSVLSVTGVEGTTAVTTVGVEAKAVVEIVTSLVLQSQVKTSTVSTTTNIIDPTTRNFARQTYVDADKPRIVYVEAA